MNDEANDVAKADEDLPAEPVNPMPIYAMLAAILVLGAYIGYLFIPSTKRAPVRTNTVKLNPSLLAFQKQAISKPTVGVVQITNVKIHDLDGDKKNEILVCDSAANQIVGYWRDAPGKWSPKVLGQGILLKSPAHATPVDLDKDGDLDIVVAVLGGIRPSDELVGRVVLLENKGGKYEQRVLLEDVRRVADVQPGDFDDDGDVDLIVGVFGYARGEVILLENRGSMKFRDHQLLDRPGIIHVPVGDLDGDGDLDVGVIVSQHEEELWGLENLGKGKFKPRKLHFTHNYDVGSGGLVATDLDQDGDLDFLLPQGDNLEYGNGWPQPYHGCVFVENLGNWKFKGRQIGTLGGTYAVAAADLDNDKDLDVVMVSMSNEWRDSSNASVVWLENNGKQEFKPWQIDTKPVELVTVACGDVDGDNRPDIVAGGLHLVTSAIKDVRRVTLWRNGGRK